MHIWSLEILMFDWTDEMFGMEQQMFKHGTVEGQFYFAFFNKSVTQMGLQTNKFRWGNPHQFVASLSIYCHIIGVNSSHWMNVTYPVMEE